MRGERAIFLGAVVAGMLAVLADALFDYLVFNSQGRGYLDILLVGQGGHEWFMRGTEVALLLVFALVVGRMYRQRRLAHENARRNEVHLRTTLQSIADGVIVADPEGRITMINPAAQRLTGWGEDAVGRPTGEVLRLVDAQTRQPLPDLAERVRREGQTVELGEQALLIARDGREIPLADGASPVCFCEGPSCGPCGAVITFRDVGKLLSQQEALRRERAFASAVLNTVGTLIVVSDTEGRVVRMNRALEEVCGYSTEEVRGQSFLKLVFDQTGQEAAAQIFRDITPGISIHRDGLLFDRQGNKHMVHWSVNSMLDGEGRIEFLVGTGLDVTEHYQAERDLLESRRQVATLMSNLPGMVYRCRNDQHWTMEFVSEGCRQLTGYAPEDLLHNRCLSYESLIVPEDRHLVRRAVEDGLREGGPFAMTYRIADAEARIRWVWEQGRGVYSPDGELLALEGFIADVTQRKEVEEQLRQSQKMEAIGRLAGGIAHDFNNQLTVIRGYADLLLAGLPPDSPLRDPMEHMAAAADRAAALTGQLLAFSRKQVLRPETVDLNNLIAEMLDGLGRMIGEDIQLVTHLQPELGLVQVDPVQAHQAIMNICINSRDAMPEGGRLIIETADVELTGEDIRRHGEGHAGPHVMIAVSDTGTGMDAETLARVFDPFFTTKPRGKGTGLGLAMVYGFVRQTGGTIYAYSEPGKGTTIKIYLPRVEAPQQRQARPAARPALPRGSETVLIVEDDEAVRNLVANVLNGCGYRVLEAANTQQALAVVERHEDQIQLVLSDVVMPGMSGPEMIKRVLQRLPAVRVIFMTGYTENVALLHGLENNRAEVLPKPFSPERLTETIRRVLDQAPADTSPTSAGQSSA